MWAPHASKRARARARRTERRGTQAGAGGMRRPIGGAGGRNTGTAPAGGVGEGPTIVAFKLLDEEPQAPANIKQAKAAAATAETMAAAAIAETNKTIIGVITGLNKVALNLIGAEFAAEKPSLQNKVVPTQSKRWPLLPPQKRIKP